MSLRLRQTTLCALSCLLLACGVHAANAQQASPPLPAWKVLQFEQKAFWATARSRIEVEESATIDGAWTLTASSSVVSNSEEVEVNLDARSGQVISRSRLSRGSDQRFKSFDYGPEFILRERRSGDQKSNVPASQWPVSSTREIPYPEPREGLAVIDDYTLLLLADRLQASKAAAMEVIVHTEFNFYTVRMTVGNGIPVSADLQVTNGADLRGRRETRAVALQVSPRGELEDKPDFSLLGLRGDIILFFDKQTGLPLQLRGDAPRIGATEINLKVATLREPVE